MIGGAYPTNIPHFAQESSDQKRPCMGGLKRTRLVCSFSRRPFSRYRIPNLRIGLVYGRQGHLNDSTKSSERTSASGYLSA